MALKLTIGGNTTKQDPKPAEATETKRVGGLRLRSTTPATGEAPTESKLPVPAKKSNADLIAEMMKETFTEKPAGKTPVLAKPDTLETDLHYPDQPEEMGADWVSKVQAALAALQEELESESPDKTRVNDAMGCVLLGMKAEPAVEPLLLPHDCGRMVRALRLCYKTTLATKQATKGKKTANKAKEDDAMKAIADLDFDL